MKYPSLSVFYPAHNEEANIGPLTEKTVAALERLGVQDYEVIIVNDGSRDRTREVADGLAARFPKVRAIHHEKNKGYGGAVWTGIRSATKEYVFFTDGDGQFDINEIELFLPHMREYDAVLGYRMDRADPFHRKVFAFLWGKLLIRTLLGVRLRDLDCAFKLFRRDLFEGMQQEAGGAMVTAEIMAKLMRMNIRYREIGVHHYPRTAGQQSGGSPKVILRAFKELMRLYGKLRGYTPPRKLHQGEAT